MSTESIILLALIIAAALAALAWQLRKKKAAPASPPAQATPPTPAPTPAPAPPTPAPAPVSKPLTAADYAESFFSGWLAGMPIKPYELPAHIKGYQYLREAIMIAVQDMDVINAITKVLYPQVAKTFATTPSRVVFAPSRRRCSMRRRRTHERR